MPPPALVGRRAELLTLFWQLFFGFSESVRFREGFLFVGDKAAFDFFNIFSGGQRLGMNAALNQSLADGLVVRDMLAGNGGFAGHPVLAGVENCDFGGKIFGLEDDGRRKVGQRTIVRDLPLGFHRLGRFAKERMIALAADEGEVLVAAGLLVNDI